MCQFCKRKTSGKTHKECYVRWAKSHCVTDKEISDMLRDHPQLFVQEGTLLPQPMDPNPTRWRYPYSEEQLKNFWKKLGINNMLGSLLSMKPDKPVEDTTPF